MGPGVGKSPLETMGAKYGGAAAGNLALGFGSELVREAAPPPVFSPLAGPSLEKYVYGRSEYEMLSPVLTCEST